MSGPASQGTAQTHHRVSESLLATPVVVSGTTGALATFQLLGALSWEYAPGGLNRMIGRCPFFRETSKAPFFSRPTFPR